MHRHVEQLLSTRPGQLWAAVGGAVLGLDFYCHKNSIVGDTLSECIRVTFGTETTAGKVRFIVAYAAVSAWFIPHIIRRANEERSP